jgi:NADPH-dependent curcumin reductase CurA
VVKELGFDACVDHKAGNLYRDLKEACPKGIDVNFENVGGEILDTLLRLMNPFSRVVVCGRVSEYNATEPYGLKNFRSILVNRIKVQGMIVCSTGRSATARRSGISAATSRRAN